MGCFSNYLRFGRLSTSYRRALTFAERQQQVPWSHHLFPEMDFDSDCRGADQRLRLSCRRKVQRSPGPAQKANTVNE